MIDPEDVRSECKHHWMIDSPNGPTSSGVCKLCGERGEFKNSIPITGWDRQGSKTQKSKQVRS